jgi:hypothetical protein
LDCTAHEMCSGSDKTLWNRSDSDLYAKSRVTSLLRFHRNPLHMRTGATASVVEAVTTVNEIDRGTSGDMTDN